MVGLLSAAVQDGAHKYREQTAVVSFGLEQIWSATKFATEEISSYAEKLVLPDTRRGLVILALLLVCLQVGTLFLQIRAGHGEAYFYTFCMLSLLSVHILVSAHMVKETRVLHTLAMTYLVMSGTAIALIAHRMGDFNVGLMGSAVLLIVAIPLVPWGLKEALAICVLVYGLFTFSTTSVSGRFNIQTIWTLQFLFLASSLIACALVARNVRIRKDDIETRFNLEKTQRRHEMLSMTDALTGAWNRRFLDNNFKRLARDAASRGDMLQLALLDIDKFKHHNDSFGHQIGDQILIRLVTILTDELPGNSVVVRMGGDEFAVLFPGLGIAESIEKCLDILRTDPDLLQVTDGMPVTVSAGFAALADDNDFDFAALYRRADAQMYNKKSERPADQTMHPSGAHRSRLFDPA